MSDLNTQLDMSAHLLYEEAQKRGISCTTFGDSQTILMEKNGKSWYTIGSRTSLQSSVGRTISNQKNLTKKILEHFTIPTAKFIIVKKSEDLEKLELLTFPVVMKPIAGAHGKDVIVGIKTIEDAKNAYTQYGKPVLFEEQLLGIEYRIVCVNYKFVAAAYRKPAFVTGDGVKTVTHLIIDKNAHPLRGDGHASPLTKITIDSEVEKYLAEQNLTVNSVIPDKTEVYLRKTANLSTGGEAFDVTSQVCEENQMLFEKIAKVCDLNTLGIDIMCQSLDEPIVNQKNAGVIEINGSPGLRMHKFPMEGSSINIATNILDMLESAYNV